MFVANNTDRGLDFLLQTQVIWKQKFDISLILTTASPGCLFHRFVNEFECNSKGNKNEIVPNLITLNQALIFPDSGYGEGKILRLSPSESGAAQFEIDMIGDSLATVSVLESSLMLHTGSGISPAEQIEVFKWTFKADGSDVEVLKNNTLMSHHLRKLSIGGFAKISPFNKPGIYTASATLKLMLYKTS